MNDDRSVSPDRGFSLLELLIVLAVFSLILGGLFSSAKTAQARYGFAQDILDSQQSARSAIDMMSREIRQAGFPKTEYYDAALGWNASNSNKVATGFITVNSTQMGFEGDINEDGIVELVEYRLNGTVLERSAVAKPSGGGTPTSSFVPMANNIRTLTFNYYDTNGNSTTTAASVKSVSISLDLSTNLFDPQAKTLQTVSLAARVCVRNE